MDANITVPACGGRVRFGRADSGEYRPLFPEKKKEKSEEGVEMRKSLHSLPTVQAPKVVIVIIEVIATPLLYHKQRNLSR